MELDRILHHIRRLEDLPALFVALGQQPLGDPVPGIGIRLGGAVAVARAGNFPWLALASERPEHDARGLARRLAARGRTAGVVALDVATRRLALSVAFDGAPVLAVGLDCPSALALAALGKLAGRAEGGALAYAAKAADALSAEEAGARFFREFRATLERMTADPPAGVRVPHQRGYVLLQLVRPSATHS